MTEKKKYKKICNKYRKELRKIAKETYPWDYCFMMHYFETCLRFMQEYYTLGYNVVAIEDKDSMEELKDHPTRLESITKALQEYEAYFATEDKYFIKHDTGGKENKKGIIVNGVYTDWRIENLIPDDKDNREACFKESAEHWEAFWNTVKDNIQSWWD